MATPLYPQAWLLSPSGQYLLSPSGERLRVVVDPAQAHDRVRISMLEIEADRCSLTFGVAPCTASGTPCYNTRATCKAKAAYTRAPSIVRFVNRGQRAPAGAQWLPYITALSIAPTEIKATGGLAARSQTTITLIDEPHSDVGFDPYRASRSGVPGGTFWGRFIARNAPTLINRTARIRRGWWGAPFNDGWFTDSRFVIDSVRGPDSSGNVSLVLSDPIKLLDKAQYPAPSSGKLAEALPIQSFSGTLTGATANTATLPAGFIPLPNVYLQHELVITANVGAGQARTVTAWNAATGVLTVTPDWDVTPANNSQFSLRPLYAQLGSGEGAQYANASHVRIGAEIIAIDSVVGDQLRWTASSARAAFGSTAEDHDADSIVQACAAWIDADPADVLIELHEAAGIDAALLDTATLAQIQATWLRNLAQITACVSAPRRASDLVSELTAHLGIAEWWNATAEQVQFAINAPASIEDVPAFDDSQFIEASVERVESERLTQTALFYAQRDAARDADEPAAYLRGEVRVDLDAQSANEYGDERAEVRYSRWLSAGNALHVSSLLSRRLSASRDAPIRITVTVDPRTTIELGALADVTTRRLQTIEGNAATIRARAIKLTDGDARTTAVFQSVSALGLGAARYAFIAPNGQANYQTATADERKYAYIVGASGTFADSSEPYRII